MSDELTQQDGGVQGDTNAQGGDAGQGGEQGSAPPISWLDSMPEDLRGNESIKKFADPGELAKAYLDAQAKVVVVPETPEGYEVQIPEGHPVNQDFVSQAKAWAKEAGLSSEQFAKFANQYVAAEQAMLRDMVAEEDALVKANKAQWGARFDAEIEAANKAFVAFVDKEAQEWFTKTGLQHHPVIARVFNQIGKRMAEDRLEEGSGPPPGEVQRTPTGTPIMAPYPEMRKK